MYPQIAAGQRITTNLLQSMLTDEITKAVSTDRVTNTVLADPDLVIDLEANSQYFIEFFLLVGATTTADIQTKWTVPSGASGLKSVIGPSSTAADANADLIAARMGVHGFGTPVPYSGVRNSTSQLFRVYEHATVVTSAAGVCSIDWGQVTTNATAARMSAGSKARWKKEL